MLKNYSEIQVGTCRILDVKRLRAENFFTPLYEGRSSHSDVGLTKLLIVLCRFPMTLFYFKAFTVSKIL